jgi:hypothetical protein
MLAKCELPYALGANKGLRLNASLDGRRVRLRPPKKLEPLSKRPPNSPLNVIVEQGRQFGEKFCVVEIGEDRN